MPIIKFLPVFLILFPLGVFGSSIFSDPSYFNSACSTAYNGSAWYFVPSQIYPNCASGVLFVNQSVLVAFELEKNALQAQVSTLQSEKSALQTQLNMSSLNQQSVICPSIWSFSGSYEDARQLGTVILGLFAIVFIIVSAKKYFL